MQLHIMLMAITMHGQKMVRGCQRFYDSPPLSFALLMTNEFNLGCVMIETSAQILHGGSEQLRPFGLQCVFATLPH